jgi:hypothetical protein
MAPLRRWMNTSLLAQGLLVLPVALLSGWLLHREAPPVVWILQSLAVTGAAVGTLAWRRRKDSREAGVAEGRVLSLDRRIRKGACLTTRRSARSWPASWRSVGG